MTALVYFLAAIGVAALVAVGAAIWFFGRIQRRLNDVVEGIGPFGITLEQSSSAASGEVERRARAFEAEGFRRIGAFSIREMPVTLVALLHASERAYAVVYQHPKSGVWSDVCLYYADAGSLTVSNTPLGGMLDQRPAHVKVYDASADERRIVEMMRGALAPGAPLRAVSEAAFVSDFQRAYQDEMDWRMGRGGATLDEVRRVAAGMPERFGEATIAQAREIVEKDAMEKLTLRCREAFAATLNGAEWERIQEEIVVIHERLAPGDAWAELSGMLDEPSEAMAARAGELIERDTPALELVETLAAQLPQEARWRTLARLDHPVAALVLRMAWRG